MRIAIVAPLEIRVPPIAYGGTELVVGTLTEALVRLGHDVTLFASGDSRTSGKLVSIVPEFLRKSERSSPILSFVNMVSCLEKSDDFDIIHNHTNFEGLATAGLVNTPMLTTFHGHLTEELIPLFMRYTGWYNTVSKSAKSLLPPKERFAGVVYNAIETATYPFSSKERSGFLLYLSRFSPEKGAHLAIEIARRLNMPLVMAGNLHPNDQEFFNSEILPYVDGKMIRCEGAVDDERKKELMMEAKCLLAPITWPEPFGLFMIEAMAYTHARIIAAAWDSIEHCPEEAQEVGRNISHKDLLFRSVKVWTQAGRPSSLH